jgi:anion-transporting  ArsA/GET3 family ATPase
LSTASAHSPKASPAPLLARRLVIVSGKGGTGKTTVAAALGLAAAEAGRRVLVAEVGRDEHVPRLFGRDGPELAPGLHSLRIDPYDALAEYLALQVGMRPLVERALRNRGFRQLMDASPGWRELITLGKIWHLEQQDAFDLIVVDAPATGHGLTFLDVPRVVVSTLRAGPLRRHAEWVADLVRDAERTVLLPVTLAEELPVRETLQLVERVREQVGVAVDRVVVNAFATDPCPPGVPDLDARLARLAPVPGLPGPDVASACVRHLRSRHELNRRYLDELARRSELPAVVLPFVAEGVRGPEALRGLATPLLAEPT